MIPAAPAPLAPPRPAAAFFSSRHTARPVVAPPVVAPPVVAPPVVAPPVVAAPPPVVARSPEPVPAPAPVVARSPEPVPAPAPVVAPAPEPVVAREPAPPVVTTSAATAPATPWTEYEKLGLTAAPPTSSLSKASARLLISTYRLIGFAILTLIVVVLVGYVATSAFYFVDNHWVQPMVMSPTDPEVIQLESEMAEAANTRDRLAAELEYTDELIASQQAFQAEFATAIKADLGERKESLSNLRKLAEGFKGQRSKVRRSSSAFASSSKKQLRKEYEAGLINRGDMLAGQFQLAQISSSNMTLAERQVEFEGRARELENETRALERLLSKKGTAVTLSYDVLRIKREYDDSQLETRKAITARKALVASLERQSAIVTRLQGAPQLRAAASESHVAFVPYDNFDHAAVGTAVYGCAFKMVVCKQVGTVRAVLAGEVTYKHPERDQQLRGRMIELELTDASTAEDPVLFVGRKPLWI